MNRLPQPVPATPGQPKLAVVIPCYRVRAAILDVLQAIGPEVGAVYCVDDACPDRSGNFIEEHCADPRVRVLAHAVNQGVGGATLTGFRQALADGADIVVKLDGDGQMDPALLPRIIRPILEGRADYAKGNRFVSPETVRSMPWVRLIGNAALSFITKFSTGYWNIFDPTNGYVALHTRVLAELPLDKIHRRFFFESDLLFRLGTIGAVVEDVPMTARYGEEESNLRVSRVLWPFLVCHLRNTFKRLVYAHYLRNFSAASVELVAGVGGVLFALGFGAWQWLGSIQSGVPVTAGTVMLAALPAILGTQFLLSFLNYDARSVPSVPLHKRLLPAADTSRAPGRTEPTVTEPSATVSF